MRYGNTGTSTDTIEVLLIEDNPGEARLIGEFLREGEWEGRLHVVNDGEKALAFLRKEGDYREAPSINLILLDLHLPKRDGWEVLATLKNDERLRRIPVVVLTSSEREEDIRKAYDLHASCYLTKPATAEDLSLLIRRLQEFWLMTVKLPRR
ncbi:MAG: response regulator [Firmicutes bacterium]|nr:response regulator [Bacillota bacterium]